MLAVLLLGVGSVATAWCGLQSSRWNGEEARESRDAGIIRIDASESFSLGTQKFAYDANTATEYAHAVADGDEQARSSSVRASCARSSCRCSTDGRRPSGQETIHSTSSPTRSTSTSSSPTAPPRLPKATLRWSGARGVRQRRRLPAVDTVHRHRLVLRGRDHVIRIPTGSLGTPRHRSHGSHVHRGTSDRPPGRVMVRRVR